MKKQLKLSINAPCQEKFQTLQPTKKGGFCSSCSREVIDFTTMTDQEIVDYFDSHHEKTCGRFHESQLKLYTTKNTSTVNDYAALGMLGLSLVSLLASSPVKAQEKKPPVIEVWKPYQKDSLKVSDLNNTDGKLVKGTVYESGGSLPGASIWLKGTRIGTDTNFDGNFTFPKRLKSGDVLVFAFLGFDTVEIQITEKTKLPLRVVMKDDPDIIFCNIMGEVQVEKLFTSKKSKFKKQKKKG